MPGDNPDWLIDSQTVADDITPAGLSGVATGTFDIITTPGKSYQSLLLVANSPSATDRSTIQVRIKDPTGTFILSASYSRLFPSGTTTVPLPVPCVANGNIDVTITQNSGTIVPNAFKLYGTNVNFGGYMMRRWDGYNFPNGAAGVNSVSIAFPVTLLSAPGAGSRYLLKWGSLMVQSPAGAVAFGVMQATVGGATLDIITAAAESNSGIDSKSETWGDGGMLLDYNTAVSYTAVGAPTAARANLSYETVG